MIQLDQVEEITDGVQCLLTSLQRPEEIAKILYLIDMYTGHPPSWFDGERIENEINYYLSLLDKSIPSSLISKLHDPEFRNLIAIEFKRCFYES